MTTKATLTCLIGLFIGLAGNAYGQTVEREDVIWVPFLQAGESITIDGELDEAVWADAATMELSYGDFASLPGSGWFIENLINTELDAPSDPPSGTIRWLADGDDLYIAIEVQDRSIGGRSLAGGFNWNWDGIFLPFRDISRSGPNEEGFLYNTPVPEFMITWWNNPDTTQTGEQTPGIGPRLHANLETYSWGGNAGLDSVRTAEQMENWEMEATVNGVSSDDTHGDDEGYVIETRINLAGMGYNIDDAEGAVAEMGLAINDADWYWPVDQDEAVTSRVWAQSKFANTFFRGSIKLYFDPAYTTGSADAPMAVADFVIPHAESFDAPTIDGALDEAVWEASEVALTLQYGNEDLIASFPGTTSYGAGWWQPDINGIRAEVQEPSPANIKWFYKDNHLYLGIDVDDQSVDTASDEGGDGIAFYINPTVDPDTLEVADSDFNRPLRFEVTVGEGGEAVLGGDFPGLSEDVYEVGMSLKGSTTPADPEDVDEGYQIEIALDLTQALGFPADLGDNFIFLSAHLYDSDLFPDPALNYRARVWLGRERWDGPPAVGFLTADTGVDIEEGVAELPERVMLHGNYPNPFNPATTLRYELPASGQVAVQVFDVLGRKVAELVPGLQGAGAQQYTFEAAGLASGIYFYRVQLTDATGQERLSNVGRMLLAK